MGIEVVVKKSGKKDKQYDAVKDGKKTVSFGATGYSDFIKHKDEARKKIHSKTYCKSKLEGL